MDTQANFYDWESDIAACVVLCLVAQLCLTLCNLMNCSLPGSSVHGDSPGKNTGVGCHALLQEIFPTQRLNPGLLHCREILYWLSHWDAVENQRTKRGSSAGKESACNAGDPDSIPGSGRSPGGWHGSPLQYSCLENPHGQKSLGSYSPWGHKQSDTTEWLSTTQHTRLYGRNGAGSEITFIPLTSEWVTAIT